MIRDQSEVGTLSRRSNLLLSQRLKPGIRFLGPPLPAYPWASLAVCRPFTVGRIYGLTLFHCGGQNGLGFVFTPEITCLRERDHQALLHIPCLLAECISTFHSSTFTTFTSDSLTLAIPFKPSSHLQSCSQVTPASQPALRATLSPELRTAGLLQSHVWVGYCWQNSR